MSSGDDSDWAFLLDFKRPQSILPRPFLSSGGGGEGAREGAREEVGEPATEGAIEEASDSVGDP